MYKRLKIGVVTVSLAAMMYIVAGGLGVRAASEGDGAYRQLGVYSEVLQRVRSEYVEEPNMDMVRDGALKGLVESLDSNSSYLSPMEYKRLKEMRTDQKAGIGATISKRYGFMPIVAVVPGGPADKAGIEPGDLIESINGRGSRDISLAEMQAMLAGPKGSNIEFTVLRPRRTEPEKVTVTRDEVSLPATQEKVLESGIGYIKPGSFVKGKAQEIAARLKQVQNAGAKKLILDLRDTAEGEYAEAIAAANLFLDHGNIATLKGQTVAAQDFNADPAKAVSKLPMVVLVNRATAGPAEIVAAAILENKRGEMVGEKTFGVGTLQKLIEVPDGSALVLSIAKYYSPTGKALQDTGLTPSVVVAADAGAASVSDDDDDSTPNDEQTDERKVQAQRAEQQLKKAIEVLTQKPS
ncbi:MAG: PDZ domain-containing protein [Acidobacteriales bacterium]|nr:PDZ domain-containing protein [Terriglobales bacterium]